MTWGLRRPVILLPARAGSWDCERRRIVLLHELVHIRRADWLLRLLGRIACSISCMCGRRNERARWSRGRLLLRAASENVTTEWQTARYLQLNELSTVDFSQPPLPQFAGPSFVNSDVENLFVGLQVGAMFHWDIHPCFELNALLKAMGGNINRKIEVTDRSIFAGGPHSASSEDDEIVFGAEVELGFKWRIHRRWAITGGYNLQFLDGVVRAYDAMDFSHSNSGAVQARQLTDQMLIHSVFLGLNLNL